VSTTALAPPGTPPDWAEVERRRLASEAVLGEMESAFELAKERAGSARFGFCVAGRPVHVEFAGAALVSGLTRALRHLEAPCHEPSFEIRVWESQTTGAVPSLPRQPSTGLGLQRVVASPGEVRRFYAELSRALYCLDAKRRLGFACFESTRLPSWDVGAPLRPLWAWWAESEGAQLAHGAVVGSEEQAVLLAGKGGSGKSTTALACFRAGLALAGDDYVIIDSRAPHLAHSLYSTVKVQELELERRFPELARHAISEPRGADKRVLSLCDAGPGHILGRARIRAVAAHGISTSGTPSLTRASAVRVLAALAPSSLLQLPGPETRGLERLSRTVRGAKTFVLEAGKNERDNVELVQAILAESAA
jgi:hypothetical protein